GDQHCDHCDSEKEQPLSAGIVLCYDSPRRIHDQPEDRGRQQCVEEHEPTRRSRQQISSDHVVERIRKCCAQSCENTDRATSELNLRTCERHESTSEKGEQYGDAPQPGCSISPCENAVCVNPDWSGVLNSDCSSNRTFCNRVVVEEVGAANAQYSHGTTH